MCLFFWQTFASDHLYSPDVFLSFYDHMVTYGIMWLYGVINTFIEKKMCVVTGYDIY